MIDKIKLLLFPFFLVCISIGNAQTKAQDPIDEFGAATEFHLLECKIKKKLAFAKLEAGQINDPYSMIGSCKRAGLDEAKKLFPKANRQLSKKPSASKLLKEYYVVWMSAMDGVSPVPKETDSAYEARQAESARRVKEAWSRFEIESSP